MSIWDGIGSGGGVEGTGWTGTVATYDVLPTASSHTGETYLVVSSSGFLWNKRKGLYLSNGSTWDRLSNSTLQAQDNETTFVDNVDTTKGLEFELSNLTSGEIRVLTMADRDYNLDSPEISYEKFITGLANPANVEGVLFYDDTLKSLAYYNDSEQVTLAGDQDLQSVTDLGNLTSNSLKVAKVKADISDDIIDDRLNEATMTFGIIDNTESDVLGQYNYFDYSDVLTGFGTNLLTRGIYNLVRRAGSSGWEDECYFLNEEHIGMINGLQRGSTGIYSGIDMDVRVVGMSNSIDWNGLINVNAFTDNDFTGTFIGLENIVKSGLIDNGVTTRSKLLYGLYNEVGVGTSFGTCYAMYNTITSEGDGGWLIYNDGLLGDNLLGQDGVITYFGTGFDASIVYDGTDFIFNSQNVGTGDFKFNGGYIYANARAGATQIASGASAGEVWKTASHATLPDNVLMIGV